MNAVTAHLDDLLTVLKVSAGLRPVTDSLPHLRLQIANRLDLVRPDLAARVRALDEWHVEVLVDFLADATFVAEALDSGPSSGADDTRVG
jgi:hypothetical protein